MVVTTYHAMFKHHGKKGGTLGGGVWHGGAGIYARSLRSFTLLSLSLMFSPLTL